MQRTIAGSSQAKNTTSSYTYKLVETKKAGYKAKGPWTVSVVSDGTEVTEVNNVTVTTYKWKVGSIEGLTADGEGVYEIQNEEILGKLTVKKEVSGVNDKTLYADKTFTFTVTPEEGDPFTMTVTGAGTATKTGLKLGKYTVAETGHDDIAGYDFISSALDPEDGVVTLTEANAEAGVSVTATNTYEPLTSRSKNSGRTPTAPTHGQLTQ